MKNERFFDDGLFLSTAASHTVYGAIRELPIIDYHCHLSPEKLASDASFGCIGELWLAEDHYKWRAMRACGIDEKYITGDASYREKFLAFASVMPSLAGNPLYYFAHLELAQIFDIHEPLCAENAEEIYEKASAVIRTKRVSDLLSLYRVSYIATTDDPLDDLAAHATCKATAVRPTYRPDRLLAMNEAALSEAEALVGYPLDTKEAFLSMLEERLDYFVARGCRISDHGFTAFPACIPTEDEADDLYARRFSLSEQERDALRGYFLVRLARLYHARGILMQIHFGVLRNVNPDMLARAGTDSGFDVMSSPVPIENVIAFFAALPDEERPETVVYSLSPSLLPALVCATGAFRHVRVGAAWWFNDTKEGIRENLTKLSEYGVLGTHLGMLTDSRSFASYARFDFFRRILADHLGRLVDRGELSLDAALSVAKGVAYENIKGVLRL